MAEPIRREGDDGDEAQNCLKPSCSRSKHPIMEGLDILSRKEKRKVIKKIKRKQMRREMAVKCREEEEAKLNDPEEHRRIEMMEREEAERREMEIKEFADRERALIEAMEEKRKEQERRRALVELQRQQEAAKGDEHGKDEKDEWEYIEEGPAEIIWQGNEITVKKKRIRVPKKDLEIPRSLKEDADRPTSNPLPPESEGFAEYTKSPMLSAQQVLENVSQQVPNFGTEQDKAHCPFHLKTGTCRFGQRCSRVHFYPDKSCTILIKNMYSGPGLAWEQDEGLEVVVGQNVFHDVGALLLKNSYYYQELSLEKYILHTEEEVEHCYEDFYEDVHTEFLKYGEIMNFKVCRNGSSHLRGNVYVHYKSLEYAMAAYHSANGRFFAGKQVTCEYVNVTKWRVAICGEYMKSRYKTCSRGVACNFIHCFRNPGGDYEWADWDKPPPRYWVTEMASLFGYHGEEEQHDRGSSSRKTVDLNPKRKCKRRSESSGYDDISGMGIDDDERRRRRRRMRHKDDPKYEEALIPKDSHHRMHNKRSAHLSSDDDGPKEYTNKQKRGHSKSIEHEGDGCLKSRRSWTEEGYSDRRSYDRDGDSSENKDNRRRKWRSNRTQTIELKDRWDPNGTEVI